MYEPIYSLIQHFGGFLFRNRKIRRIVLRTNIILIIIGLGLGTYISIYGTKEEIINFTNYTSAIFFVPPVLTIGAIVIYIASGKRDYLQIQLELIREERREITQKINESKHDIFNTIQLSLNQLNEYYTINKEQARGSFNFSIYAVSLGLAIIITGICLHYFKMREISVVYITGISGTLLEFIGGAYFLIYKKSLEQVNFFFSQLIKVQDTMLAIDLAKHNDDQSKRNELEEKIIISLLERSLK